MSKHKTNKPLKDSQMARLSTPVLNQVKAIAETEDRSVRSVLDQVVPLGIAARELQKNAK